jgi:hypothetical protein
VIRSAMPSFTPPADAKAFAAAQPVLDERGKHLRGIAEAKGLACYPLSTRVYDLNCTYPMYGKPSGNRQLYTCGRCVIQDDGHWLIDDIVWGRP